MMWSAKVPAAEAKVLLLGWSYKAEVGDPRETPAEPLAETLMSKGITVGAWDPHLDDNMYPEGVEVISHIGDAHGYEWQFLLQHTMLVFLSIGPHWLSKCALL